MKLVPSKFYEVVTLLSWIRDVLVSIYSRNAAILPEVFLLDVFTSFCAFSVYYLKLRTDCFLSHAFCFS